MGNLKQSVLAVCFFLVSISSAFALDTPKYSDHDDTYSAYQGQIATLYRAIYKGEGQAYQATDTYTDYNGNQRSVITTVTPKLLTNDAGFAATDLDTKMDYVVPIQQYSLKKLNVSYASKVNTSNKSKTANLTRKSDAGYYLAKDCSNDATCNSVQWINQIDYALYVQTAAAADLINCPYDGADMAINNPLQQGISDFTTGITALLPVGVALCMYNATFGKIVYANSTSGKVALAHYADSSATFVSPPQTTALAGRYAQKISVNAGTAANLTTFDPLTGAQTGSTIDTAALVNQAATIKNETAHYSAGTVAVTAP